MHKILTIVAVATVLAGLLGTIGLAVHTAEAASITTSQLALEASKRQQSGVNAVNTFLFDTLNKKSMSIMMKANGGNFASETLTIRGALTQNGNYTTIETESAGTGATKSFHYSSDYVNVTGVVASPVDFRYLNFSLPGLGANQTSVIEVTAK